MSGQIIPRMSRRQLLLGTSAVALSGAFGSLLAACGSGASSTPTSTGSDNSNTGATGSPSTSSVQTTPPSDPPKQGGVMAIGQPSTPVSLDPTFVADWNSREAIGYMFDTLSRIGPDGSATPSLATSWEMSKDGLTWTFHLQKDVQFHDGTAFDASAAKFTLDRYTDPKVNSKKYSSYAPFYEASEVVDPATIKITLKKPFPDLLPTLAWSWILSPKAVQAGNNDFAQHPVGTGPFTFQSYTPDSSLKMVRNPHYWNGAPYLDGVTIEVVPNTNTQMLNLETQKLDWMYDVPPDDVSLLKDHGVNVVVRPIAQFWFLMLNLASGPTTELPVRQAIAHAIDRETIIKVVLKGYADISLAGVPKNSPFFHADVPGVDYDVDKAKQLLDQAGWKADSDGVRTKNGQPLSLTVLTTTRYPWPQISQVFQEELSKIGFQAKIQSQEWGTFLNSMRAGSFSIALWELRGTSIASDDGTAGMLSTTYWNVSQIAKQPALKDVSQQIDSVINQEQSALNVAQRSALLKQFQELVYQNQLLVWLWNSKAIFGVQPNAKGYQLNNYMYVFLEKAWLA